MLKNLLCTKKCIIFVVLNQRKIIMVQKEKIKLTEKEIELIIAIRNYNKSYPNGYPQLLWYIDELLNELLEH